MTKGHGYISSRSHSGPHDAVWQGALPPPLPHAPPVTIWSRLVSRRPCTVPKSQHDYRKAPRHSARPAISQLISCTPPVPLLPPSRALATGRRAVLAPAAHSCSFLVFVPQPLRPQPCSHAGWCRCSAVLSRSTSALMGVVSAATSWRIFSRDSSWEGGGRGRGVGGLSLVIVLCRGGPGARVGLGWLCLIRVACARPGNRALLCRGSQVRGG